MHDAVTRSLVFINDQKVLPNGHMKMSEGEAVLRAVIQTQNRQLPRGQLIFRGVQSLSYDSEYDAQPGKVTVEKTRDGEFLRFVFGECEVLARSATLTPLDWKASEAATPDT